MLLYDTIMEAKGAVGRALCCGTNFVMRRVVLEEVGGWDENSVSEDLATSFLIHQRGWKSIYVRRAYAKGLGPLDLASYWKQQKRWAVGNTTVARQVLRGVFTRKPRPVPMKIAIGYFWSAGYYITALALAGLATLPMLLVLASYIHSPHALQPVPDARPTQWLFLSTYPLYAVIMLFPYVHMRMRGYPIPNLVMVQGLLAITIPVYIQSVVRGLMSRVTRFEIAPKFQVGSRLSGTMHLSFWRAPQALASLLLLSAGVVLTQRVSLQPASSVAWIALFWTFFYSISLGHYFLFVAESRGLVNRKSAVSACSPPEHRSDEAASLTNTATFHAEETEARS
jgi:cellulose synthase/poly-beta-1,6-N-acetylglucosamine synthase-like glycosyltransferase